MVFFAACSAAFMINNGGVARFGIATYVLPSVFAVIALGLTIRFRRLFGAELQIAIWAAIVLALMSIYLNRDYLFHHCNRLLAAFLPGRAIALTSADGTAEVLVHKTRGGHFETPVKVNGRELFMLVDTGASSIVLSHQDARRVGINTDELAYNVPVSTASGLSLNAFVTLRSVSVGPISRQTIAALVSPEGELAQSLLGMNFLSSLASFQMKADELRLTDY
ncbi:hypothetical protein ADU59_28990 [Pararhizobium polonicum]|uniref:Aspartic protease n=1 Tax=Pararhizobium polonicum TaxID=1612624 RepID=A0A1C7NSQ1_9HYPH|nr:hypothetical protein ADU59_28990 [Pararhizobium polonicum]